MLRGRDPGTLAVHHTVEPEGEDAQLAHPHVLRMISIMPHGGRPVGVLLLEGHDPVFHIVRKVLEYGAKPYIV